MAGVLCGSEWRAERCFLIERMAVHPTYIGTPGESCIIRSLVQAALDYSLEQGFNGRVAGLPEEGMDRLWNQLGFIKDDLHIYRLAGYFAFDRQCQPSNVKV